MALTEKLRPVRVRELRRRHGQAGDLVPLVAVQDDGLALLEDGTVLRGWEVAPLSTLVLDEARIEQLTGQLHRMLARIPAGQRLSLYLHSAPLAGESLADREREASERIAEAITVRGEGELAEATRRLAFAQARSLRTHVPALPAAEIRCFLLCPFHATTTNAKRKRSQSMVLDAARLAETILEQRRFETAIVSGLKALRLEARPLAGEELVDLVWERCSPDRAAQHVAPPSQRAAVTVTDLPEACSAKDARARVLALKSAVCEQRLDAGARSHLRWERGVEQVVRLGSVPEETWLGWTQYLTLCTLPFTLAVHFGGRDRHRDRSRHKRRHRQLWAANRGQERMGKLVAPDREDAEQEARRVTATLAQQAASSVYDLSVYLAIREPGGDVKRLAGEVRNLGRELTGATDAVINESPYAQLELWQATLPLGIDPPRRSRQYLSINAADSWPLLGAGCGSPASPTAIPLGFAQPGRELVWIDPYDPEHPNHVTVVAGQSGGGKTMLVNLLLGRAMAKGARGAIIDRSGHYDFPAATIPGAASVRVGGEEGGHRINPWDGEPTAAKVAFLVALHELLLSRADETGGLAKLEENLLGLAIRAVYRRCQSTGETPRETLLQEELTRRYCDAKADGARELAAAYHLLAESLHNYVGSGPYAWLCDHETTFTPDAPLVVYDTRSLPDSEAPAALLVICEQIVRRVEADREALLTGDMDPRLPWAGKSFLVFEEVWKLIGRDSTGRWVNELARRSRHLALWLVAISQQLDDFQGPQAEALISQSSLRLILCQNPDRLAFLREQLGLSEAAVEQVRELQTVKREYSQVYLVNGSRGEGTVTIAVADLEYWRCTSDPVGDEPLRRLALRQTGPGWDGAWRALACLADPAWHQRHATTGEEQP